MLGLYESLGISFKFSKMTNHNFKQIPVFSKIAKTFNKFIQHNETNVNIMMLNFTNPTVYCSKMLFTEINQLDTLL